MPLAGWERFQERADLRAKRRRSNGWRQESQSSAARLHFLGKRDGQLVLELGPAPDASVMNFRLRAVRIVQPKDGCLCKRIACSQTGRMVRIALDLRGPRHVTFDQNSAGDAAERNRRRVEQRLAGDDMLRLADVRDDFLGGKLGAAGESG